MKKIIELVESTVIIWLPILALVIAHLLSRVITAEMIMKALGVVTIIATLFLLKGDIKKCLEERK